MRVLVTGDRNWDHHDVILERLRMLPTDTTIIHGKAPGADSDADRAAHVLGFEVDPYEAKWSRYGKSAGPIRNRQMLEEGKPDLVLAFHDSFESSKGTKNMVEIATKAGVRVQLHNGKWRPETPIGTMYGQPASFLVSDVELDASDGAHIDGYLRVGERWEREDEWRV